MLRLCFKTRRFYRFRFPRRHQLLRQIPYYYSSFNNPIESPNNSKNSNQVPSQSPYPILHHHTTPLSHLSTPSISRNSFLFVSATTISALVAVYAVQTSDDDHKAFNPLHAGIDHVVNQTNQSFKKIFYHVKQTGVAASVLWQSLRSVLSSANHDVRSGFELRVAALLADIAAANASRRASIVRAGDGAVVDWLLESVAFPRNGAASQSESARALAYLIADPNVSSAVLGRPGAVPNLLRFIFCSQPQRSKKQSRRSSLDLSDSLKGRSMLVAAIMDIVTSNCVSIEKLAFKPSLPDNAQTRDIAAAIQVIEEGGMHLDESQEDQEDGGKGMRGIGIKFLGETTVVGLSRTSGHIKLRDSDTSHVEPNRFIPTNLVLQNKQENAVVLNNMSSAVVPGLWDDLHCEHVAVPFATWALANWAMASEYNRIHIQELDQDGKAVMTALVAPERSVKWHGSLVARLLLEDDNISLNDYISDWSSSLLSTVSQASNNEDIPLAQMALSAFLVSVDRSSEVQKMVMEKGLHLMREIAKQTTQHKDVQEALAKALELVSSGDLHFSLKESQKWSGILLPWVFENSSSEAIRLSAIRILSSILEDHGPASLPISQAWLAFLLSEILSFSKTSPVKGKTKQKPKNVKTRIEQSNILTASQIANQLAGAVVNLAGNQLGTNFDSVETFPLADLLSLEPFTGPFKNLKKVSVPKLDVADSVIATLKGIKALAEMCKNDSSLQEKITDYGVLCLLRHLLLHDDYEKLADIKAYGASRALEAQDRTANSPRESSTTVANDPSSLQVPPTAHIRRHAARLLTILSLLPKVQKLILADKAWCQWLEDCANGKIQVSSDLKIQSYARASLSNIFCGNENRRDSVDSDVSDEGQANRRKTCPQYDDMIFLINPELSHWKCDEIIHGDASQKQASTFAESISSDSESKSLNSPSHDCTLSYKGSRTRESPLLDVVFVHGLRGGPFKTWRIAEEKSSTKSGLVEKIDEEAGKLGTFWPAEWLSADLPQARLFTLKYKSNLTQWSGASLPLQEVSSMLLKKLVAAGIGDRPVVFVTHSMGGLVFKQMLHKAKAQNLNNFIKNTVGVVFYSCPHFGSKLADMPMRIALVLRPAPSIGELRSGSPRLVELNDYMRHLHKKGLLDVLSFCETKVTPIVEGYGGWAFRIEIVPIESAYPGFGELVVLESTDHINSCKPLSRSDASYAETLKFLQKLKTH